MKASTKRGAHDSVNHRRFSEHFEPRPELVIPLSADNPSVLAGRSIFHKQVVAAKDSPRLLISGAQQRKIGGLITKGAWRGMPIYTLTLEERATCPTSCGHWLSCYGNGMPFARRHEHGVDLELRLADELLAMDREHPTGFVVRLHVLGDFYSVGYAGLWGGWLRRFRSLRLFGYTAHPPGSPIGLVIQKINGAFQDRCLIRFSGDAVGDGLPAARTIWRKPEAARVPEGIVCPAQTERTACCGTCGLCWATTAPIAFIAHGRVSLGRPAARRPVQPVQTGMLKEPMQAPLVGSEPHEPVRMPWAEILHWAKHNMPRVSDARGHSLRAINQERARLHLPLFKVDDRAMPYDLPGPREGDGMPGRKARVAA